MNIFVLDSNPIFAARYQCDGHISKMPLETAQLLCLALDEPPYKPTHVKHPCALWALASQDNYCWLLAHGQALCDEYRYRYGKTHGSEWVIAYCWDYASYGRKGDLTPFPQCMPEQYKVPGDAVKAYRNYYLGEKRYDPERPRRNLGRWRKSRPAPEWWNGNE